MKQRVVFKINVLLALLICSHFYGSMCAQEVEVQGELKVTQMNANENGNNLVIHNSDGTLGTRSVASLPPPPLPIDTLRNLASDLEVAKHLCDCPNLPPFLIDKLLESGYTEEDLLDAGVPYSAINNAQFTCGDTLIDNRDGKMYTTIRIGGQCWMAENLNAGTMLDGSAGQTDNSIIEKYCYDNNNANCDTYGALYQWDEMMQYITTESIQGVCPIGWHLPSDDEYKALEIHLGMSQAQADAFGFRGTDQGSKMAGNEPLWTNGSLDEDSNFDSSGFMALPAGFRIINGAFSGLSGANYIWSSSESNSDAWIRNIISSESIINRFNGDKGLGLSVRCVRD